MSMVGQAGHWGLTLHCLLRLPEHVRVDQHLFPVTVDNDDLAATTQDTAIGQAEVTHNSWGGGQRESGHRANILGSALCSRQNAKRFPFSPLPGPLPPAVTLQLPSPSIWADLRMCFGQQNVSGVLACVLRPGFKKPCSFHSPSTLLTKLYMFFNLQVN